MRFYLLGFMGSGKSYLGKLWAAKHNLSFYDLDELIEQAENDTIKNIFEQKGEQYFRNLESKILQETISLTNVIIACGGGTACFNDNMRWINKNGISVFLNASVHSIHKNIVAEKNKRPLLANITDNDLQYFIESKLDERLHYYALSKIILQQADLTETGFNKVLENNKDA